MVNWYLFAPELLGLFLVVAMITNIVITGIIRDWYAARLEFERKMLEWGKGNEASRT